MKVRIPEDVVWQQVEDRIVLLDLTAGEYHALNDSGSRMWIQLAETGDAALALARIRAFYDDTDDAVLDRDLTEFIATLVGQGLLAADPA